MEKLHIEVSEQDKRMAPLLGRLIGGGKYELEGVEISNAHYILEWITDLGERIKSAQPLPKPGPTTPEIKSPVVQSSKKKVAKKKAAKKKVSSRGTNR